MGRGYRRSGETETPSQGGTDPREGTCGEDYEQRDEGEAETGFTPVQEVHGNPDEQDAVNEGKPPVVQAVDKEACDSQEQHAVGEDAIEGCQIINNKGVST